MPLSKERDKERKRREKGSYCGNCQFATFSMRGLKCDLSGKLIQGNQPACRQRRIGRMKLFAWK